MQRSAIAIMNKIRKVGNCMSIIHVVESTWELSQPTTNSDLSSYVLLILLMLSSHKHKVTRQENSDDSLIG